ncbi:Serine protease HTRA4, partial [Frankliniella fusca]
MIRNCGLAVIAIVLSLAVGIFAIVCFPNICDRVHCKTDLTAENCTGVFKPEGGFCGCCPLCVTVIAEGGSCI